MLLLTLMVPFVHHMYTISELLPDSSTASPEHYFSFEQLCRASLDHNQPKEIPLLCHQVGPAQLCYEL
jgi:hypothetical protein